MNLKTNYLGLSLRSPIVVSASPLSEKIDNLQLMEDAGAGAIVLFSLFEEQIRKEMEAYESVIAATSNTFPEASSYFPEIDEYKVSSDHYLELIMEAKSKLDIPIIASLNGTSPEGWIDFAQQIQEAGADGLEVNIFFIPVDLHIPGEQIESRYIEILKYLKEHIDIPVSIKLNPYFSSMANMAHKLELAGADGLVLFNRFYQPDFDIDTLEVVPSLSYSIPSEIRLPLLWTAALYGKVNLSLAATTGVHSAKEVIKYILAGSDIVMVASTLFQHGIGHIKLLNKELAAWMERQSFNSLQDFQGILSQKNIADPTSYERANYIKIVGLK